MKKKSIALLLIILSIFSVMSITSAETSTDVDVLAIIEEMPYEQRMVVAEDVLKMIAKSNGIDALEAIFQSVKAEYPAQNETVENIPSDELTEEMLSELLASQPLAVIETEYLAGSEQWKSLYPDMLSAILVNNSDEDIQNAVVAFVAWDKNNLPVKIEGQFDFMGESYVKYVSYDEINLIPGDTFGKDKGYSLSESTTIVTFKAIVVSYETFDGNTWENPYFDTFCDFYEGKKLVHQ